jgi:uncharacterized membrane protein HdeD (DUF308 family)
MLSARVWRIFVKEDFKDIENISGKMIRLVVLGIILTLVGIGAIIHASAASAISLAVMGLFLTLSGAILGLHAFWVREWRGVFISLLMSLVSIIVGAFCIFQPLDSALAVASLFGAFFLVIGLIQMLVAGFMRFHHWGIVFLTGILSTAFGGVIFAKWPFSAMWVLGVFVGLNICLVGLTMIVFAQSLEEQ